MTRNKVWIGIGVVASLVAIGAIVATTVRARFGGEINALGVDLGRPDAYVSTPALSKLPRDMVKAPVLREVLDEDFAFYYEEHEDRLGLRGAVKRIAFEHDKTLTDQLLEAALDEPAEMAFWADAKGAPRYWLMALTRNTLARTVQELGSVALKDNQLSVIESVRIGSSQVSAYALKLSPRRTLALLSLGNRVVVLSDPGLLFDAERHVDGASLALIAELLSGDTSSQSVYRRSLGLGVAGSGHTLVADARLLSFGYGHFFPGVQALRIDIDAGGAALRTHLRVADSGALPTEPAGRALWSALPAAAASCAVLPVDWAQLKLVLAGAKGAPAAEADKKKWDAIADRLDGPAAVCWYAKSQLHTPIVVARVKTAGDADMAFALDALSRWLAPANAVDASVPTRQGVGRWAREVKAPWGSRGEGEETIYRPTLALQDRWLTFSPDDALVELALDAQARRYPSMADALPVTSPTLAVLAPKQIAAMVRRESFEVIGPDQELFRQAAERRLVPRLDALGRLPAVRATTTGSPDAQRWVALDWQPLAPVPAAAAVAAPVAAGSSAAAAAAASAAASAAKRGRS